MPKYLNTNGVPLSVAVWLATDDYDGNSSDSKTISVTSLLKPLKQIVLAARIPQTDIAHEISGNISSSLGSAVHTAIELAWKSNYKKALADLGYPQRVIDLVRINPTDQEVEDANGDIIPVYMEQREQKLIAGWTVTGKYDFIIEGRLEDFKSTSTYTFTSGNNDEKYILQGSLYRWLNPNKITSDTMAIQFIFTDFQAMLATPSNPKYPKHRFHEHKLELKSLASTEAYVINKLGQIDHFLNSPEEDIPQCTDEELWRDPPKFKYYASGKISPRSTKNFDTYIDAHAHKSAAGKGIVVEAKGTVKACKYCPAAPICKQKDQYILDGSLKL